MDRPVRRAESVLEMMRNFAGTPLSDYDELDVFYENSMEARTSEENRSPTKSISRNIRAGSSAKRSFLLLGHSGCGKSTELNVLYREFMKDSSYPIAILKCELEMDRHNPDIADLMILMKASLFDIAEKVHCRLNHEITDALNKYFDEITEIKAIEQEGVSTAEFGLGAQWKSLLAKLKGELKIKTEKRTETRRKIQNSVGDWIRLIEKITARIQETCGKIPVIIFEDFDKIAPLHVTNMFTNFSNIFTGVPFYSIYTCSVAINYSGYFNEIRGAFETTTLPMIRIVDTETAGLPPWERKPYEKGYETILNIIHRRANPALFESESVERLLIEKTGGNLRDLFEVIRKAADRVLDRNGNRISRRDAEFSLTELKSQLKDEMNPEHYDFLANVCKDGHSTKKNSELMEECLRAGTLLEYYDTARDGAWRDVHPLMIDFLRKERFLKDETPIPFHERTNA